MEAIRNLACHTTMDQCYLCENDHIEETTIPKHIKKYHMEPAIDNFIEWQCSEV